MQVKSAFFPIKFCIYFTLKEGVFRSTEAPPFSNLFNSKYIHCQRGKLAHSLKMSTGHFLKLCPHTN